MPFRKALIWIRNQYYSNRGQLILLSTAGVILTGALGFLADFMLPWDQWAILVRAVIAIPASISLFVLGYAGTLAYVNYRSSTVENYRTWRVRLSPTMRQRVSAVIGAVLFVLMFAVTMQPGYTFVSSIIIALVVGLFAFMRRTSTEISRDDIGLPDARDVALDSHLRTTAQNALKKRNAEERKAERDKSRKLEEELEQQQ